MIKDARALQPEHVPRDLHHREGQIDHLASALEPVTHGDRAEDVCLYGPSGAGKTTVAKYTLRQLARETFDVRWGYANCMADNTRGALLHRIVDDARLARDLRRSGTHTSAFLDRIRAYDGQVVAVIDEVDLLPEPRTLLSLLDVPNCAVICICIDEDRLLADPDQRLESRLRSAETVTLDAYSQAELVDILDYRVEHGLAPERVRNTAIKHIADCAAGDAREAIALLRRAAQQASSEECDITPTLVDAVADEARAEVRERHVRSLGTHQRALYEIICEAGSDWIEPGTVYARYEQRVQEPRSKRSVRRYLGSLERYGLIELPGTTKDRRYRCRR